MRQVEVEQLALFDAGPNLAEIREEAAMFKRHTRAKATLVAYDCDWKTFTSWCESVGRKPLPATPDTLALYVTARLRAGIKVSGAGRHVAAIAHRHRQENQPIPDRTEARLILAGARRRRKEMPVKRTPILPSELRKICTALLKDGTAQGIRDRAVLTLGFATGLRRGNIAALDLADVRFVEGKGLAVTVRSSKTDQKGLGVVKAARLGIHQETCPAAAMRDWLKLRGSVPGPLFFALSGLSNSGFCRLRISGKGVNDIVKRAVKSIGLNPAGYGAHSLRAGFVTAAHLQGTGVLAIMEQTGHTTVEMVKVYLRNADPFAGPNPL